MSARCTQWISGLQCRLPAYHDKDCEFTDPDLPRRTTRKLQALALVPSVLPVVHSMIAAAVLSSPPSERRETADALEDWLPEAVAALALEIVNEIFKERPEVTP